MLRTIEESGHDFWGRGDLGWFLLFVRTVLSWKLDTAQGLSGLELVLFHGVGEHRRR